MPNVKAEELRDICVKILDKNQVPYNESLVVADSLVKADLMGITTHGVRCLKFLVARVQAGTIIPGVKIKSINDYPSTTLWDGCLGFGQVVGVKAMKHAIGKAKATGISVVSVRNANHFGIASYYSTIALGQNMIGVSMCNSGSAVAPYGGRTAALGTNPISFAIPTGKERPIVLDMATSVTAQARIAVAAEKGEKIPEGWALDEKGRITTDPRAALRGALLPMGGPKGYGLAVVIDVLSGILAGWVYGKEAKANLLEPKNPPRIGQLFLALNIESFIPVKQFKEKVDRLIQEIKSVPPQEGFQKVLLPGEPEALKEEKHLREGIPLDESTWQDLDGLLA